MPCSLLSEGWTTDKTLALRSRARQMCQDFAESVVAWIVGEHEMEKIGIRGSGSR